MSDETVQDVQADVCDALSTHERAGDAMREAESCEDVEDLIDNLQHALDEARLLAKELKPILVRAARSLDGTSCNACGVGPAQSVLCVGIHQTRFCRECLVELQTQLGRALSH